MRYYHSAIRWLSVSTLVICLLFPGSALAEQRLFWKAESEDGVAWLLGSLHFGEDAMYPLPAHIIDALAGSEVLVVEVDLAARPVETVARAVSVIAANQGF
jgi:uncharacterized protein YbaP (TraB family)